MTLTKVNFDIVPEMRKQARKAAKILRQVELAVKDIVNPPFIEKDGLSNINVADEIGEFAKGLDDFADSSSTEIDIPYTIKRKNLREFVVEVQTNVPPRVCYSNYVLSRFACIIQDLSDVLYMHGSSIEKIQEVVSQLETTASEEIYNSPYFPSDKI